MYKKFYRFRDKPFSLLPDPEFLYLSEKHRMALTLLEYGLWNHASFSVITGDIGTGKTTMIRHLLNQIDRDLVVGLISNTHPSFGELLHWILLAFNIEYSGNDQVGMYKAFVDFLIRQYAANRRTVLIIDEAQNMSPQALEELRMLSNINVEKDQVLQIILVGQIGLRAHLRDPSLEQFAQRVAVDYHLEPLSAEETRNYIRHRLTVVGDDPDLFSDDACEAVFQHSGGVPRLINALCDTALVYGYAEQSPRIDARLINDVANDKRKGGILPLRQASSAIPGESTPEAPVTSLAPGEKQAPLDQGSKKKLRILIASDTETQRTYLKMVLERSGMQVVAALPIDEQLLDHVDQESIDVVLMDMDEGTERKPGYLDNLLDRLQQQCRLPILFNDSSSAASDTQTGDLGKKITLKLTSLMGRR